MKYWLPVIILILLASFKISTETDVNPLRPDKFFEKSIKYGLEDSAALMMVYDVDSLPVYYYQHVITDVCEDKLCKPVDIFLYWDASGSFLGFRTPENMPLTKKDHVEFTNMDYYLLYSILNNPYSSLSKLKYEELTTVPANQINKVDGVSGATAIIDKNAIVPGAVYTCYTLWNLVYNPDIVTTIQDQSKLSFGSMEDDPVKTIRISNLENIHPGKLSLLLRMSDDAGKLKKFGLQRSLTEDINELLPIKALMINNYINRQIFVFPEIESKLANCATNKKTFLWMIRR